MHCSCRVRVFMMRMDLVFLDSFPMQYFSFFHHGLPKLLAQSERGTGGGTWTNRPIGVYGAMHPVTGCTCVFNYTIDAYIYIYTSSQHYYYFNIHNGMLTFLVSGSNQCEISFPALATIGFNSTFPAKIIIINLLIRRTVKSI